jgi:aryl-phospho-beta-D-glucosidase BglC (GH1 family)
MPRSNQPCIRSQLPEPLRVSGVSIRGAYTKKEVLLQGTNWFGFNVGQTSVDGLWAGGTSFAIDFYTIVYKIHLLGFNAVRLPFTFDDLRMTPLHKVFPCHVTSRDDIIKQTVTPGDRIPPNISPVCPLPFIATSPSMTCNVKLVTNTTVQRFGQTIDAILHQEMYVILDYHPMGKEKYVYDVKAFVREWVQLWKYLLKQYPHFKGRVLLDIMNEPDSMGLGWTHRKTITGKPTYSDISFAMMDAIYAFDKDTLFLVEGTGQTNMKLNWGDGFVTDISTIRKYDIDDASVFFERLSTKPYRNNLVISPHLYGPTISRNRDTSSGKELWKRLDLSFGYLYQKGFCKKGTCMKFPIVIGEFGSFFKDPGDITFFRDVSTYIKTRLQNKVGWVYWVYNANSGDTGGIVTDDWQGIDWMKVRWLHSLFGLRPWYKK